MPDLEHRIFTIKNEEEFNKLCLEVFAFQYGANDVYHSWCEHLGKGVHNVKSREDIPFLPIEFFKTHKTVTGKWQEEIFFQSSGTTNSGNSIHYIKDKNLYIKSFVYNFTLYFGNPHDYCFLVLLPSYQNNPHSSLIFMMDYFVRQTENNGSRFFYQNLDTLTQVLISNEQKGVRTILFGVSYALLDVLEQQHFDLHHSIIFETGGMKGRRKEMTKKELHKRLCEGFGVDNICAEYGMCELLSQAYSLKEGIFHTPPQMKILLREVNDPLSLTAYTRGAINVIDLANLYSCSFIATDDLGEKESDQTFRLLGRLDNSDIRGCNLLYL